MTVCLRHAQYFTVTFQYKEMSTLVTLQVTPIPDYLNSLAQDLQEDHWWQRDKKQTKKKESLTLQKWFLVTKLRPALVSRWSSRRCTPCSLAGPWPWEAACGIEAAIPRGWEPRARAWRTSGESNNTKRLLWNNKKYIYTEEKMCVNVARKKKSKMLRMCQTLRDDNYGKKRASKWPGNGWWHS